MTIENDLFELKDYLVKNRQERKFRGLRRLIFEANIAAAKYRSCIFILDDSSIYMPHISFEIEDDCIFKLSDIDQTVEVVFSIKNLVAIKEKEDESLNIDFIDIDGRLRNITIERVNS